MSEHILVTGSSGTIGTALVDRLLARDYAVTGVDRRDNRWLSAVDAVTTRLDLTEGDLVERLPADPDLVVHLAANARVHELVERPSLAAENVEATLAVLEYARRTDTPVLFASSREVYGNDETLVSTESETAIDRCESPYTASKASGESFVSAYENCYSLDRVILRFSNVYGRFDASNRVVPLFIAQAEAHADLTVYGARKILDFTYVDDCVDGIVAAIENFDVASGTTLNVASGEGTSLVALAERVVETVDSRSSISVEPNRTGEVSRYVADITRARKLIDYEPTHSFEAGLERTVGWYRDNAHLYDEIRG